MLSNLLNPQISAIVMPVSAIIICGILLKLFKKKLPKDHGREFAVNGMKSAGKIRGAGIIFICAFIICSLLFIPVSIEYGIYYLMIFLEMLSGYLDDRAEKPWGEYLKGVIDLVISAATAITFVHYNPTDISFFGMTATVPKVLFGIIAALLVWMLINAVNCSDGIDGFSSTLSIISFVSVGAAIMLNAGSKDFVFMIIVMICALFPYLWANCEPSTMLMGDAGSRGLGIFLCIALLKTGNILLVIPLCFMICLDGLLGIAKIVTIRFLHINPLKNIRTPLHDHFRKNKGWSNTQVIYRFSIIQVVISILTLGIMYFIKTK